MLEDFEFRLRARTDTNSSEAMLIKYLNSRDTLYPARDMVMIALKSYWLPLACQSVGEENLDLEQLVRSCLYRLQLHQQYLLELLGESLVLEKAAAKTVSTSIPMTATDETHNRSNAGLVNITIPEPSMPPQQPNLDSQQRQTEWLNPFKTSSK